MVPFVDLWTLGNLLIPRYEKQKFSSQKRQITKLIFDHIDSLWPTIVKLKWLQIQTFTLMGGI